MTDQPRTRRDLSKLNAEEKPAPPPEEVAEDSPYLAIRECGTNALIRTIPIQRGFSWRDVNAIVSTIIIQPNTMKAGLWLDMEHAYWSQEIVR